VRKTGKVREDGGGGNPPAVKSQVQVQIVCEGPNRKYLEQPDAKPEERESIAGN